MRCCQVYIQFCTTKPAPHPLEEPMAEKSTKHKHSQLLLYMEYAHSNEGHRKPFLRSEQRQDSQ